MSRLSAAALACVIADAEVGWGDTAPNPERSCRLAHAVLDLAEERDAAEAYATAHDGEVRRGREAPHAMTRERDALAAEVAAFVRCEGSPDLMRAELRRQVHRLTEERDVLAARLATYERTP